MKNYSSSRYFFLFSLLSLFSMMIFSCNSTSKKKVQDSEKDKIAIKDDNKVEKITSFNADSAYQYIKDQLSFGARVPGSEAHKRCGDYIVAQLKSFGGDVLEQVATVKAFDGKVLPMRNIIYRVNPTSKDRIILAAHWDSRPFSDQEKDVKKRDLPVLAANDGASGVGVLMEIARQLKDINCGDIGFDILLFDVEDYGPPADTRVEYDKEKNYWCLGSQYWAKNAAKEGYSAKYGILLDMVGAPNATFYKEGFSIEYASFIVEKVWKEAAKLGYGAFFVDRKGGFITDDHVPINRALIAPCIDIIQCDKNSESGFGTYWHTQSDDINSIDKKTLKAVGETVLNVICSKNEK